MRIVRISPIEQVSEQIPWALSVVRLIRVGRTWLTRIQWMESGTGYTLMGRQRNTNEEGWLYDFR